MHRENRVCNLCQGGEFGDGFHYLLECTEFMHDRFPENTDVVQISRARAVNTNYLLK